MGRQGYSTAVYFKTSRDSADSVVLIVTTTSFHVSELPNNLSDLLNNKMGVYFSRLISSSDNPLEKMFYFCPLRK